MISQGIRFYYLHGSKGLAIIGKRLSPVIFYPLMPDFPGLRKTKKKSGEYGRFQPERIIRTMFLAAVAFDALGVINPDSALYHPYCMSRTSLYAFAALPAQSMLHYRLHAANRPHEPSLCEPGSNPPPARRGREIRNPDFFNGRTHNGYL